VWDSQGPYRECRSLDEVVPAVMEILRALVNREPSLLKIHAGVASFGSGCVLLPAAAGSGKTTLTAGLIHAGATYYSDEIAILDAATLRVMPVPLPLSIKDGSLAPLKRLFPGVEALTAHVREDYQRVRYLPPPAGSLASERGETVRWLVFPRFDPRGGTTLAPLTRADGFRRLLAESLVLPERLDRTMVASLVQWLRDVECFELSVSSLDSAVDTLRELMLGPAPPPSTPG
jgi:hypothetical protein